MGTNMETDVQQPNEAMEVEQEKEEDLAAQLDEQPYASDKEATAIRMRMPNGTILQRYFKKAASVNQLYIWCKLSMDGKDVSIIQTMPRMKLDDQKEKTLQELGLIRATLVCSLQD